MGIELKKERFRGADVWRYENSRMILGYTGKGYRRENLGRQFKSDRILELKQVHSAIVLDSELIREGSEGDGIVVGPGGHLAVIRTADCVPLFFWEETYGIAGILHVGWRGLRRGIESVLVDYLRERDFEPRRFRFFAGPGIERDCYEVGEDLYQEFRDHVFRERIFDAVCSGKYRLDIKKGITLSLEKAGIPSENITLSEVCTYCDPSLLPSYRRDGQANERIYNFLMLK